jgi:hypothetical protein
MLLVHWRMSVYRLFIDHACRHNSLLFDAVGITLVFVCKGALNSQNLDETKGGYRIGGAFISSLYFGHILRLLPFTCRKSCRRKSGVKAMVCHRGRELVG